MSKLITPDWTINSVYHLSPQMLFEQEISGLIVDLDNTLLAWNEYNLSQRMKDWIETMQKSSIQIFIVSNNNHSRVEKAIVGLEKPVGFFAQALKPRNKGFQLALDHFKMDKDKVAVVGDQLITDVIGAKRMGLRVILVKPLVPHDNIYTWVNRTMEKALLQVVNIDRNLDWGNQLEQK